MARYDELRGDETVKQWLVTIRRKPRTEKSYLMGLQKYLDYTGMSPDELLTEGEEEAANKVAMRKRMMLKRLLDYRDFLEKETDFAATSKRNYLNAVMSFYRASYIEVPKLVGGFHADPKEENMQELRKEDIRDILKVCDPLERALILVGVSSGLSEADIMNLKVRDFKFGYDPETGITTLKLTRVKTGVKFVTFLSPEASAAVQDYLSFRNRSITQTNEKKRIRQLLKQHVATDDGHLFIIRKVSDEYLQTRDDEMRKFDDNSFTQLYWRLAEKSQKVNPVGWNACRSHNFRKYFNSCLLNNGFDFFLTDHMMGHKADAVDRAYFWSDAEKLKEIYKKAIPYLTIEKQLDISESQEYKKLQDENTRLNTEMLIQAERQKVRDSEIEEIRAEMEKMKEASASAGSIKEEYMQFADMKEIIEMKDALKKELEEISELKEMMLKAGK